jgi:hypothetical protein
MQMDDMSGIEGEWRKGRERPAIIEQLLRIAGEIYFPFLIANAAAAAKGAEALTFEALGLPFTQGVFKYQVKCLDALRAAYHALSPNVREELDPLLARTGCRNALV